MEGNESQITPTNPDPSTKLVFFFKINSVLIAVCNNVGEAAFLGRNKKFEKFWTAEL